MSGGARGTSTSLGLADEVLVPLLSRVTTLKTSIHAGSAGAMLEKIEREMAQLKDVVGRIDEAEKEIRYSFDPIERIIDDALRAHDRDTADTVGVDILSKLRAVDAEMDTIKAKVRQAYNLANGCGHEEERRAPSPRAAASLRSSSWVNYESSSTEDVRHSPQMRHLRLAVGGLEERLRGCVLFLGAFTDDGDATIKKRLLIHWWIGEGFVGSCKEGKSRFEQLVDKGFITPLPRAHCDKIHRCKLLPWFQELLADVAKRNAFFDVDGADSTRTRRVILCKGTRRPLEFNPEVRSIYNVGQKYVQLGQVTFAGKKELRTLQLGQWREFGPREQMADASRSHVEVSGTERLAELDKCRNLRYVSFRGISRIQALPDSIGKLRELVVLDLRACHDLEELGQGITKLDRLEYLDLSECHLLIGMPRGIGRLTRLEVLKGFVIANSNCKDPCHLNELTKLHRLRTLSVTISRMAAPAADEFKKLGELRALKSLTIVWGVQSSSAAESSPSPFKIAKMEFALPPGLAKLDLRCFPLPSFQQWVRPKHVKKLYIRGGKLRTLGDDEDWKVEVLHLRFLKDLHYDLHRLRRSFRELTSDLTLIHECPNFRT